MHWYEWKIWDRFYVLQYFLQLLPLDVLTLPAHLSPQTLLWHPWEIVCISALFSRGTEMLSIPARQWGKYIQILEQREFRDWNFFWRSSVGFFQWAADRLSDLMPAGAICLRAGGLVGERGLNAALSSDSGTHRFHSPPSSFCRVVNPVVPLASRGPAWRTAQDQIKTERDRNKKERNV